ncbi:MAG: hypothetical protein DRI65_09485 [Chloroflexota bacterium]|nr:MAG: hypothetical protein DRI65_09485 [Chloroflexota bacterium]
MNDLLRYLKDFEYLIYIIIGGFTVWHIRKFFIAWEELRAAAFGLEKESAQLRLNRSAALLVVLLFLGTAEFGLVSFIIPSMPNANPLPTATLDLLASPTTTISPAEESAVPAVQETPLPGTAIVQAGCVPEVLMITYPENNTTVSGIIEIEGTVNIPDFGFYKFEISSPNSGTWLTIQAGDAPKSDEMLGFWDTTQLDPGNYSLRLVVIDNQGVPNEPCAVDLYVEMMDE